jgi:mannose-6-phosphate isomerase-like protein (cupin superfamily)
MQRRSFLRAVSSVVPAAGLHELLARPAQAQVAVPPPSTELHVVGAGEDRYGQYHTMGVSHLLFKVSGNETGGGMFVLEHQHLKPGGPALHLHLNQEEWFYVMEGAVMFQVGAQRLTLEAGESVLAPRRVPHTFSSVAESESRMMIAFCPAGKMEQYFRDAADPKAPEAEAEYLRKYEMELVGPSPFWKT